MNSRTTLLLLLAIGLCCMDISSAFHIPRNVTVMEEPTEDSCSPRAVHISWTKVRHYLNSYRGHSIAADIKGPPLKVMRCRNFLTPCPAGHTYCGVASEKTVWEALPLKERGVETGDALYLEFKEDKTCMCVNKGIYDILSSESIEHPPYILIARRHKLQEDGKTNEFKSFITEGSKANKVTSRTEGSKANKVTSRTEGSKANKVTSRTQGSKANKVTSVTKDREANEVTRLEK